jgi:uncharacterized membrane protein
MNLENKISGWRAQMIAAGIQSPVPLEELEIHLREEIERQMKSGLNEQQAFEISIQQIGQPQTLDREFKKGERTFMKQIIILAALFGMVLGGAMILPALGRWHQTGLLLIPPLLIGTVLLAAGAGVSLYGIKSYKEMRGRKLVNLGIFAAGTFFVVPLLHAPFIRGADLAGWIFCILLAGASLVFFGRCYHLNRQLSR